MTRVLFAGSFDPFTIGHLNIVKRALSIADEVIVAIGVNNSKTALFSVEQRCSMITKLFGSHVVTDELYSDNKRVSVIAYEGLTVEACKRHNANLMIRGVRTATDMEQEWALATINKELSSIETIFLPADKEYSHISSSFVRDLMRNGGNVEPYLPPEIYNYLNE